MEAVKKQEIWSGFLKKISKDVRTLNVEDLESLSKTLEGLGK